MEHPISLHTEWGLGTPPGGLWVLSSLSFTADTALQSAQHSLGTAKLNPQKPAALQEFADLPFPK